MALILWCSKRSLHQADGPKPCWRVEWIHLGVFSHLVKQMEFSSPGCFWLLWQFLLGRSLKTMGLFQPNVSVEVIMTMMQQPVFLFGGEHFVECVWWSEYQKELIPNYQLDFLAGWTMSTWISWISWDSTWLFQGLDPTNPTSCCRICAWSLSYAKML